MNDTALGTIWALSVNYTVLLFNRVTGNQSLIPLEQLRDSHTVKWAADTIIWIRFARE